MIDSNSEVSSPTVDSRVPDSHSIVQGSVGSRLAQGAFWSLFGTVGARLFSLVGWVIAARVLGIETFGALGLILGNVRGFMPFSGRGLGSTATRYIAEYRVIDPARASRTLSLTLAIGSVAAIVVSLICFSLSGIIATRALGRAELTPEIQLSAILLLAMSLMALLNDCLAGFEAFRWIATVTLTECVLWLVGIATFGWMFGLLGAIAALTAASTGAALWALYGLKEQCRTSRMSLLEPFQRSDFRVLWKFGVPDVLVNITFVPAAWFAGVHLLSALPDGLSESAFVNVAQQWRNLLLYIPIALNQVSLPILAQLRSTASNDKVEESILLQIHMLWLALMGAAVGMICFSPLLLSIYGSSFRNAQGIFVASSVFAVTQSHASLLSTILASSTRMWLLWRITVVATIAYFLTSLWSVPHWGAVGLMATYSVFFTVQILLILFCVRSVSLTFAVVGPMCVFAAMASAAYGLVTWNPWIAYTTAVPMAALASLFHIGIMPQAIRRRLWNAIQSRLPTRRRSTSP